MFGIISTLVRQRGLHAQAFMKRYVSSQSSYAEHGYRHLIYFDVLEFS